LFNTVKTPITNHFSQWRLRREVALKHHEKRTNANAISVTDYLRKITHRAPVNSLTQKSIRQQYSEMQKISNHRLSGYRIEQEFDRYGKQTDLHQPVKPDAHEV
jgi:hypothetical protein